MKNFLTQYTKINSEKKINKHCTFNVSHERILRKEALRERERDDIST